MLAAGTLRCGFSFAASPANISSRALIVIFLRGAVDGLSVIAPYAEPAYYANRRSIAIAKPGQGDGLIDLDGHFGLHPRLAALLPAWRDKRLLAVHASGSTNATRWKLARLELKAPKMDG